MAETQFNAKITLVRSDNGTEFINSACLDFFLHKDIIHQKSIVSIPQQNEVAKRNFRNSKNLKVSS